MDSNIYSIAELLLIVPTYICKLQRQITDSYDLCCLTLRYMHMYLGTLLNIENVHFLNKFCRNYFTKLKLKFNKRYDYSNERIFSLIIS